MGRVKEISMSKHGVCIYSYYGKGRLRCSRKDNYCQYWKDCRFFNKYEGKWR